MKVFTHDTAADVADGFDTIRKAGEIAESLRTNPLWGIELVEAPFVSEADLTEIHDADYVEAVRTGQPHDLAVSSGLKWSEALWDSVCASTGAVVAAAEDALVDGAAFALSAGLHHARVGGGSGYCTFNALALVARRHALAGRCVVVVDLDAHCGGGTWSILRDVDGVGQADVATSAYDAYDTGVAHRTYLERVTAAGRYLGAVERALAWIEDGDRPDLVLYNAGVDPHERCSTGGLGGVTTQMLAERDALVAAWCRLNDIAVAGVLAGGYTGPRLSSADVVGLHRQTIAALAPLASGPTAGESTPHVRTRNRPDLAG
ncbi:hypothetical protein [Rhabdothermincola salaria]|uniref:hypothetical protein n=1 Tax=Rhabdothermincola salaria TaxID=2903142 RepID=UPI001E4503EC|nr:hypothetical protein [Rhabdothermincola salaria]MCD9624210.1 hypothetical protein [Rhabdothermincola salaria]